LAVLLVLTVWQPPNIVIPLVLARMAEEGGVSALRSD